MASENYYFSDPSLARVVGSLSNLINGNPERKLREAQMAHAQAQAGLEAQKLASQQQLGDLFSGYAGPDAISGNPEAAANFFANIAAGGLDGSNLADTLLAYTATAGGTNEQNARQMVASGKAIRPGDSFTVPRQDELSTLDFGRDMEKARAGLDANMQRTLADIAGAYQRNVDDNASALTRTNIQETHQDTRHRAGLDADPRSIEAQVLRDAVTGNKVPATAAGQLLLRKKLEQRATGRAPPPGVTPYTGPVDTPAPLSDMFGPPNPPRAASALAKGPSAAEISRVRTEIDRQIGVPPVPMSKDSAVLRAWEERKRVNPRLPADMQTDVLRRTLELQRQGFDLPTAVQRAIKDRIEVVPGAKDPGILWGVFGDDPDIPKAFKLKPHTPESEPPVTGGPYTRPAAPAAPAAKPAAPAAPAAGLYPALPQRLEDAQAGQIYQTKRGAMKYIGHGQFAPAGGK